MSERKSRGEKQQEPGGQEATPGAAAPPQGEGSVPELLQQEIEQLKQQLQEEQQKAKERLEGWQRVQADFLNFKRRSEQEREELSKFANAMLIVSLLPVLDDLERALATIPTNLAGLTWFDGLRLIHRKFQAVLEAQGLQEIQAEGQDFDPTRHEAVLFGDGEDGKVLEVLQKGYALHNRVLRPAMVKVGKVSGESEPAGEFAGPGK